MAYNKLSIFKFFELLLTLVIVGLHIYSGEILNHNAVMIINGTFIGYTIILLGLLGAHLMSAPIDKRIDLFFSLVGTALFMTSGIMVLQNWNEDTLNKVSETLGFGTTDSKKIGMTKGSFCIINAIVFIVDIIFTFRHDD
ncbi:hypothetical protein PVAND_010979 [Polypedilum vanderplanki]|uniref:DUF7775 domain-containing protein n=1 Tax=Polypedilum vanderplanki TaxID=319348 RepID=A0A9J6CI65_POLVA|nr:hypothetical protein PVAND_010979 [Polypedilum vanderplanki]